MTLLEEFEEFLNSHLLSTESFHPHFNEAYRKMFGAGGKRFRPLLLLGTLRAINPLLVRNAMYAALALEMIHTYSLIHDDLPAMDNAPLRRGVDTLHVTYDEVTAILIADALNTDAFLILSQMPIDDKSKTTLCAILAKNAGSGGMVLGQALDCFFERKPLDEEQLIFLHKHKTARLIAAAIQMGAVIGGSDVKTQNELYDFGLELGLLFQIHDDIIDATKSSSEAGKPTHNDTDKNSFVNLLGLREATKRRDDKINELKKRSEGFGDKLEAHFVKILNNSFK
ncbi:MAG: polyprenyl synthetase family protein [Campylobacteraceae bacterium]|jgi:farnesyl diphosphate synthase|nr:polyprenyl synthetase family protein [Campylobacteraceae bacterium]